ncbi:polysaccharide biosynthesis/export family protein [Qipengyuania oceanensis]|uniref:polysaccharide biosynthesis/export family protein n=1 Tax=Qipengyuania oceanensis TaxID=1463597 RepID=UPI00301BE8D1
MTNRLLLLAVLASALAACAGKTPPLATNNPDLQIITEGAMPRPTLADQPLGDDSFAVGPYDELIIDVFGLEGLTAREVTVDAGGNISVPLVGSFQVAGMTPLQIEQEMTRRLLDAYVRNPRVSVNLEVINSQLVSVDGQVKKPGLYPALGNLTLMRSVAQAEGLSEFAKMEDVVVFRTSDGRQYAALYNLAAIRRGYYQDPQIYAGDRIIVGESRSRRIFSDFLAAAPLLTAPIIAVLQNN